MRVTTESGPQRIRSAEQVQGFVAKTFFKIGPPRAVGVELECLVVDPARPGRMVPTERSRPLAEGPGALPAGTRITYEPGGQVELSTAPALGPAAAEANLRADLAALEARLAAGGLQVVLAGLDPHRTPERCTDAPRYAAMEAHFDRRGPEGRAMMTTTAALQVSLDAGENAGEVRRRWHTANELAPVLTAMFADSPVASGSETGWLSGRARIWSRMDPARTVRPVGADPAEAYAAYALAAPVMCVRREAGPWLVSPGFTFAEWIAGALPSPPTEDDLEFHLTTLFPPVRAREWLELRTMDALPAPWWAVPVVLSEVLLADSRAGDEARAAAEPVAGLGYEGGRLGLGDEAFHRAALGLVEAALGALARRSAAGDPAALEQAARLEAYAERYVVPGRTPADEVLEAFRAGADPWTAAQAPARPALTQLDPARRQRIARTGAASSSSVPHVQAQESA